MPANIWHAPALCEWEGESSDDTLPVPADCFSSAYTRGQSIQLFVRLDFRSELFLVLVRVLSGAPKIQWCGALHLREGMIKVEEPSRVKGPLLFIRAKQGDSRPAF